MRTFVMGYDPYWKFELPSRRQVGRCWFQEEERFLWYSIVQFFSMRSIVPANAYDLGSWLKHIPHKEEFQTFLPNRINWAITWVGTSEYPRPIALNLVGQTRSEKDRNDRRAAKLSAKYWLFSSEKVTNAKNMELDKRR